MPLLTDLLTVFDTIFSLGVYVLCKLVDIVFLQNVLDVFFLEMRQKEA